MQFDLYIMAPMQLYISQMALNVKAKISVYKCAFYLSIFLFLSLRIRSV